MQSEEQTFGHIGVWFLWHLFRMWHLLMRRVVHDQFMFANSVHSRGMCFLVTTDHNAAFELPQKNPITESHNVAEWIFLLLNLSLPHLTEYAPHCRSVTAAFNRILNELTYRYPTQCCIYPNTEETMWPNVFLVVEFVHCPSDRNTKHLPPPTEYRRNRMTESHKVAKQF